MITPEGSLAKCQENPRPRTFERKSLNFAAKGAVPREVKGPQLAADIRAVVEPHTQADPELKSSRRYTNMSAREVLEALKRQKGYNEDRLPKERTMRDI